jgi:acetylornithine aminotransferase
VDEDGREYLDFVSGIATCALGHNNPALTKAVCDQMTKLHHVSNLYYTPQQGLLAAWLCENSCADKAFFCNSGAESNEAAIKLARRHASNRGITDPVIITAESSFHGRTLATVTATAQPKYHKGFTYGGEMVRGFRYTPYNDEEALKKLVDEINTTPEEDAKAGRKRGLAAIMLEPLQGEGGIRPGTKEYFATARKLCDDNGALLICDEVQVGMGRSGSLWGHEQLGVEPDVFTSAKALGGGVPIGAMMAKGAAAEVFGPGDHASTYGGNPLACAAGLAVAEYLSEHDILTNVRERGDQLSAGLEEISKRYPSVLGEVRGWGLLKGVAIKDDAGCTAAELVGDAMKEGLLLVAAGPSVVRFVPPLIVKKEEIDEALARFEKAIEKRVS